MISGRTRVYAIIADPIDHVRGPSVFNPLFAASAIDAVMVPIHVAAADLPDLWRGFRSWRNLGGFLVTVPHKIQAASLCDRRDPAAAQIGAVNVVRRESDGQLVGGLFDGIGFVAGLRANGDDPRGRSTLLLGAGGAASAIGFALAEAGVARLTIANRSRSKAIDLAAQIGTAYPGLSVAAGDARTVGIDLVVNATSLGLAASDPLPIDAAELRPGLTVAEIIMNPVETSLLRAARAAGCAIQTGPQMLDHQIALLAQFLGLPAGVVSTTA